jgi:predicted NodU family carbamoyl transferase
MVMSPEDALWTLENTGADTLIMGNYIIKKR